MLGKITELDDSFIFKADKKEIDDSISSFYNLKVFMVDEDNKLEFKLPVSIEKLEVPSKKSVINFDNLTKLKNIKFI